MSVDATRTSRTLHSKRSFGKYPKIVDSPAYDASEEDNDPLTDDAKSSASVPTASSSNLSRLAHHHLPRSSHLQKHPNLPPFSSSTRATATGGGGGGISTKHHASLAAASAASNPLSDSDRDGVDGDVESTSTTAAADITGASSSHHHHSSSRIAHHYHLYQHSTSSVSTLGTPAAGADVEPMQTTTTTGDSQDPAERHSPSPDGRARGSFDPAALTAEDIRAFVRKAIEGQSPNRPYEINAPPTDRPVRIYADGVYDLFHFGHALQLRQAKLSFPSVYLLVGVNSDEQVWKHKARTVMIHAERLEAVRHCRWVDEVVAEAPWVIGESFLQKYQIDYVAHDEDLYASAGHSDVYHYAKSQGKFIPTRRTPGVSTSELLERIVAGYRRCEFDDKLAKMGAGELRAKGSEHDGTQK